MTDHNSSQPNSLSNRPIADLEPNERPILIKLGGSLITDKRGTEVIREDVLRRLAMEIAETRRQNPQLRLVIGHGSGSFGHLHARRYGTRSGVHSAEQWLGFALTGDAAARLNRAVLTALLKAGVPAWSIQPGAIVRAANGIVAQGLADPVIGALARGLVPVLYGDVVLDDQRGGTIASTEEIFAWLLPQLRPRRVVLAGEVDGIYSADPLLDPSATRIPLLTEQTLDAIRHGLGGSHGVDVTGGMIAKVQEALAMVSAVPDLDVVLCSGLIPDRISHVLGNSTINVGTQILKQSCTI